MVTNTELYLAYLSLRDNVAFIDDMDRLRTLKYFGNHFKLGGRITYSEWMKYCMV